MLSFMKLVKLLFTLILSGTLFYVLDNKTGGLPPIGRLIDPFTGFWQNATSVPLEYTETVDIPGLSGNVTVKYDSNLVPHIFAGNDQDLFAASGYIIARHRLWQMELITHNAAGRLSEIIGPATIEADRLQRRIGMRTSAEKVLQEWQNNPEIRNMLESYANGINAYIRSLEYKDYPLEYKLLDYAPEEWTPLKSALLLKYMSKMLTLRESDLENTNFINTFGQEKFRLLFPDFPSGIDPIIPAEKTWDFTPEEIQPPEDPYLFSPVITQVYEKPFRGIGSNNWAVGHQKTGAGQAMLANDMHLDLHLPCLWFVAQYHTPELNAFGHILPGTPLIIQGFNDSIAWGMTNAYRDVVDWYQVEFRFKDKSEYLFDDNWLKTQKVIEKIKVRGDADILDTVYYTHHGPIVYDDRFSVQKAKVNLSMRWLAHDISYEPLFFLNLLKANNYQDFKSGLQYFSCPPQNLVYADAKGNVAMHVQGKFPLKYREQGKFILDGTTSKTEWKGYIPWQHNPSIFNPEQGFVSSANQHPVDSTYPYPVYSDHFEYFRNRRINNVLAQNDSLMIDDMRSLHNDDYSVKAKEALEVLLDSIDESGLDQHGKRILASLRNWDYSYTAKSEAAAYFEIFWKSLQESLWDELIDPGSPYPLPSDFRTIQLLRQGEASAFYDIQVTDEQESLTQLINYAFNQALEQVKAREETMGKPLNRQHYFNTTLQHYARLQPFSYDNLEVGGSGDAVNATTSGHGPSQRIIVHFGDSVRAWHSYPGGQSGNPGNPYYNHFAEAWKAGTYHEVLFMRDAAYAPGRIMFTNTFKPE